MRVALLLLLAACCPPLAAPTTPKVTKTEPTPVEEAAPQPDPTPPELRLPAMVKPLRNEIELTLDPATEDFTGTIAIDLELAEPTSVVWLNQEEITIASAVFRTAGGEIAAKPVSPIKDFVAIVPASPLPAGKARLVIAYAGK